MTYSEFIFCCSLFFRKYENLTMNDIIKDNTIKNVDSVIKDMRIDMCRRCYGIGIESIFYFDFDGLNLNGFGNLSNFEKYKCKTIKEFLNVYKINLKDIV